MRRLTLLVRLVCRSLLRSFAVFGEGAAVFRARSRKKNKRKIPLSHSLTRLNGNLISHSFYRAYARAKQVRVSPVIFAIAVYLAGMFSGVLLVHTFFLVDYSNQKDLSQEEVVIKDAQEATSTISALVPPTVAVTHLSTPEPLKSIYMTACYASMPSLRARLIKLIEETELNAIVIDVKDYTGTIAFDTEDEALKGTNGAGCRVKDMKELVAELHKKGIYVIARITVFQDPYYTKVHPELAVKRLSDGAIWKDYKGLSFIDVSAKPYWDYIVTLSKETYALGFDELNFDYVRFPSDGDMKNIAFPWSNGMTKAEALEHFFAYLHDALKDTGAKTSVDLFGMTMTSIDDLDIGQVLEHAMPYFDYVAPMVYPSHYPPNFNGWKNPNDYPYDLIKFVMTVGAKRAEAPTIATTLLDAERNSTSTPEYDTLSDADPKTSIGLFGMTMTNTNEVDIRQVFERAMPYFEFTAPVVYPSRDPSNFSVWKNPSDHSRDLVKTVMGAGVNIAELTTTPPVSHLDEEHIGTSTTAPYTEESYDKSKLRPWLQDFDYGGNYGPAEVRAQIQATYDAGLASWMLWDPGNTYTKEALLAE